jgi:hypothetical protein
MTVATPSQRRQYLPNASGDANTDSWGNAVEISFRDALTVLHGMVFGAILLLAFSGAGVILFSSSVAGHPWTPRERKFASFYLGGMAVFAWLSVFAGAYVIYPWYRAIAPVGTLDLGGYPQRLLMSSPSTTDWHSIGMEWKEHIAWFSPITLTALTYLFAKYGAQLPRFRSLRNAMLGLLAIAVFSTAVAGVFGAMLNKYAPVRGGGELIILKAETHE